MVWKKGIEHLYFYTNEVKQNNVKQKNQSKKDKSFYQTNLHYS